MKRDKALEILGIPEGLDSRTIKHAFWNLAKRYHPDYNGGRGDNQKFREACEAREVLERNIQTAQSTPESHHPAFTVRDGDRILKAFLGAFGAT